MNLIFEGMDNCGKDTQIKLIKPFLYDKPLYEIKFGSFPKLDKEKCLEYSKEVYSNLIDFLSTANNYNIICNRAHLGEYVYGQLYRGYSKEEALNQIYDKKLKNDDKTYLIVLVDSNTDNLIKREDGLSQSNKNKKLLEKEYLLFKEAYNNSNIRNKCFIDINNKSIDDVYNIIKKEIHNEN